MRFSPSDRIPSFASAPPLYGAGRVVLEELEGRLLLTRLSIGHRSSDAPPPIDDSPTVLVGVPTVSDETPNESVSNTSEDTTRDLPPIEIDETVTTPSRDSRAEPVGSSGSDLITEEPLRADEQKPSDENEETEKTDSVIIDKTQIRTVVIRVFVVRQVIVTRPVGDTNVDSGPVVVVDEPVVSTRPVTDVVPVVTPRIVREIIVPEIRVETIDTIDLDDSPVDDNSGVDERPVDNVSDQIDPKERDTTSGSALSSLSREISDREADRDREDSEEEDQQTLNSQQTPQDTARQPDDKQKSTQKVPASGPLTPDPRTDSPASEEVNEQKVMDPAADMSQEHNEETTRDQENGGPVEQAVPDPGETSSEEDHTANQLFEVMAPTETVALVEKIELSEVAPTKAQTLITAGLVAVTIGQPLQRMVFPYDNDDDSGRGKGGAINGVTGRRRRRDRVGRTHHTAPSLPEFDRDSPEDAPGDSSQIEGEGYDWDYVSGTDWLLTGKPFSLSERNLFGEALELRDKNVVFEATGESMANGMDHGALAAVLAWLAHHRTQKESTSRRLVAIDSGTTCKAND